MAVQARHTSRNAGKPAAVSALRVRGIQTTLEGRTVPSGTVVAAVTLAAMSLVQHAVHDGRAEMGYERG